MRTTLQVGDSVGRRSSPYPVLAFGRVTEIFVCGTSEVVQVTSFSGRKKEYYPNELERAIEEDVSRDP